MLCYPASSVELKQHFVMMGSESSFDTVKSNNAETPFKNVIVAMNILKFPILSARTPANGGPRISATGIMLLTMDASSIENPKERICKEMYGYNVTKLAD